MRQVTIHWQTIVYESHEVTVDIDNPEELGTENPGWVRHLLEAELDDDGTITSFLSEIEGDHTETDAEVSDRTITYRMLENADD